MNVKVVLQIVKIVQIKHIVLSALRDFLLMMNIVVKNVLKTVLNAILDRFVKLVMRILNWI
jgi:hypothetical protein